MDAARAGASVVVSAGAFEPISRETFNTAREWVNRCDGVYCPLQTFGALNEANRTLRDYAKQCGKLWEFDKTGF